MSVTSVNIVVMILHFMAADHNTYVVITSELRNTPSTGYMRVGHFPQCIYYKLLLNPIDGQIASNQLADLPFMLTLLHPKQLDNHVCLSSLYTKELKYVFYAYTLLTATKLLNNKSINFDDEEYIAGHLWNQISWLQHQS